MVERPRGHDPPADYEIQFRNNFQRSFLDSSPRRFRRSDVLRIEMEPTYLSRRLQSVPTNSTGVALSDLYTTYVVPPTKDRVASIVANVLMVSLASIWTVLRFYARRLKGQPWYFEDLLCLFALVRPATFLLGDFPSGYV